MACSPSDELQHISSNYTSGDAGTLACDQGEDIVYPEGGPGYVYDPTGYLLTLPGRQVMTNVVVIASSRTSHSWSVPSTSVQRDSLEKDLQN